MGNSNYFKRLFMKNMYLVVLLTIIVGVVTYPNQVNTEDKRQEAAYIEKLEQQGGKIDTSIDIAITAIDLLEDDPKFKDFKDETVLTQYSIAAVYNKLGNLITPLSKFGFTLGIYKNSSDVIISTKASEDFHTHFDYLGLDSQKVSEIKEYLENTEFVTQRYYTIKHTNTKVSEIVPSLTVIYRKKYPNSDIINFFISVYEEIVIPKIGNIEREGFALMDGQQVISSTSEQHSQLALAVFHQKFDINNSDNNRVVAHKGHTLYIKRSETIPNWHYVYMVKHNIYTSHNIIITTLLFMTIFALIGSVLAFNNTKKIYSPINKIFNALDRRGEFTREYDVEFIEKAIVSINNLNRELEHKLEDKEEHLKIKAFSELVYGLMTREDIEIMIEKYKLEKYLNSLRVVVIRMTNFVNLGEDYNHDKLLERGREVMTSIGSILKADYDDFMLFKLDYKSYAVILLENPDVDLKKTLTNMVKKIEKTSLTTLLACVGKKVDSIYYVMDSFGSALFETENRFFGYKGTVVMNGDAPKEYNFYYPIDMERNFLLYVEKGQFEKALILLDRLLKNNLNDHEISKEVTNEFIYSIISTIKRTLQQLNLKHDDVFPEGSILYLDFKYCESKKVLQEKIMDCFVTIFEKAGSGEKGNSTTERILAFIRENYNQDLSMNDITEYFQLSAGYISRLFKNNVNTTFKDYLNLYRVSQAKELLKKSGTKISDVASAVGCNNTGTFIRIFKKFEGLSPGEYVKHVSGKNNKE